MDPEQLLNGVSALTAILSFILSGIIFYRLACSMAVRKKGLFYQAVLIYSCFHLCAMVIYANDFFNITLSFFWFIAMMLLCFQGKTVQKLAVASVLFPINISLNFFMEDFFLHLYVLSGEISWMDPLLRIFQSTGNTLFWYIIYRLFKKRMEMACRLFDARTWGLLMCVCLASLTSIVSSVYFSPPESYKMWPAALACIATQIGVFFLCGYFAQSIQAGMERKNLRLQQSYYEELENNQLQIRRLRHDMNHHLSVIRQLLETGSREEAGAYFRQLEQETAVTNRVFTQNSIVNSVLNARYNQASELHIDCFFHISIDNVRSIDPVSLCCIFSNTLDNAIEASLKIPEPEKRKITVKARCTENGYFSLEVHNAKSNPIVTHKGRFISDKEDGGSGAHGLGLLNVREVVDKYGGMLNVSYTDDAFTVTILISNAS